MATGDDRTLENLIRSTEELVRNLEVLGGASSSSLPPGAEEQLQREAAVPLDSFVEPSVDAVSTIDDVRTYLRRRDVELSAVQSTKTKTALEFSAGELKATPTAPAG